MQQDYKVGDEIQFLDDDNLYAGLVTAILAPNKVEVRVETNIRLGHTVWSTREVFIDSTRRI